MSLLKLAQLQNIFVELKKLISNMKYCTR